MYRNKSYEKKCNTKSALADFNYNEPIAIIETYRDTENDIVLTKSRVKHDDFSHNSCMKVSDFRLENLQAIGADKEMKEYSPIPNQHNLEESLIDLEQKIDELIYD